MLVLALYVGAFLLSWMQGYLLNGVVQRTDPRAAAEVEDKLNRLPLSYFDTQPRGELLSRVTNDIDNISTRPAADAEPAAHLAADGGRRAGDDVRDLAAAGADRAGRDPALDGGDRGDRQALADAVRRAVAHTGALNAQIEEAFTGHELVKVFGRQKEVEASFAQKNEELYQAAFGAQFISGIIMPVDDVHREPQLRGRSRWSAVCGWRPAR